MTTLNRVAIIPARGGSKRIPRKNIREFCGKSIIAYSIEAARSSKCFDRIIVSTDDESIADVARLYGAEVPGLRSDRNSDDFSPIVDVVTEVIDNLQREGDYPDYICCVFATAPFVTGSRLSDSFNTMVRNGKDGIFPVVEFSYPIQRALEIKQGGMIGMVWPEHLLSRSQDLSKRFHDSGQYYWAKTNSVVLENTLFIKNCMAEVILENEAQDIDTLDDWSMAELKYKALKC